MKQLALMQPKVYHAVSTMFRLRSLQHQWFAVISAASHNCVKHAVVRQSSDVQYALADIVLTWQHISSLTWQHISVETTNTYLTHWRLINISLIAIVWEVSKCNYAYSGNVYLCISGHNASAVLIVPVWCQQWLMQYESVRLVSTTTAGTWCAVHAVFLSCEVRWLLCTCLHTMA
jgi:hypothetical protein